MGEVLQVKLLLDFGFVTLVFFVLPIFLLDIFFVGAVARASLNLVVHVPDERWRGFSSLGVVVELKMHTTHAGGRTNEWLCEGVSKISSMMRLQQKNAI